MKGYLFILACYTAAIIVSVGLGVIVATHVPWWVLIPMVMITVCGGAYMDFLRVFGGNSKKENNR